MTRLVGQVDVSAHLAGLPPVVSGVDGAAVVRDIPVAPPGTLLVHDQTGDTCADRKSDRLSLVIAACRVRCSMTLPAVRDRGARPIVV